MGPQTPPVTAGWLVQGDGALPKLDCAERPSSTAAADMRPAPWLLAIKHGGDRAMALVALLLLLPLLVAIAAAVRLGSPGPALFRQRRDGCFGRPFLIVKFRTMHHDGPRDGQEQALRKDCRVTRVGGFLRRTSLDELPQLWNVLNGTMSFVGPRPHPCAMRTEGQLCREIADDYPARLRVRPGITGLAQINGNRGATATRAQLRARLDDDLAYIAQWSLLLDAWILVLTPIRLVTRRENAF